MLSIVLFMATRIIARILIFWKKIVQELFSDIAASRKRIRQPQGIGAAGADLKANRPDERKLAQNSAQRWKAPNAEGDFRKADLVRCKISIRTHSGLNWLYPMPF